MDDTALPRLRRLDRWSLGWRLARAWRAGLAERRSRRLHEVRGLEGTGLDGVVRHRGDLMADAELRLSDGRTLTVSRSAVPTLKALVAALREGPVRLVRVADHRHFFGLYFQTYLGQVAMLAADVGVGVDGGGLRRASMAAPA